MNRSGHRITPERYRTWKDITQAHLVMGVEKIEGPVELDLQITPEGIMCAITPSHLARVKYLRGDIDNYAKAVMDALQPPKGGGRGVIEDDRQVVQLTARFVEEPL